MFLLGFFSTHIGLAILWIAYLGGVACFSLGVFGDDAIETSENLTQNVIEYRVEKLTNIQSASTYYLQNSYFTTNPSVADYKEISPKSFHPNALCLGRLMVVITQPLFQSFANSFRFLRPPPSI